ncbi:hypothetical protein [Mucilaginibacter lacusdianchii]|uniref:hypothetical protein n=1 Tax=Mucilaginibacter lacusdianchii TaxID=2684211 RepID=UPI00131A89EA|nr:hypothetical protein [Mucilaginibacter sp. JXJ CY 39]
MKKFCFLFLVIVGLVSCGKGDQSYIPSVNVKFSSTFADPNLSRLSSPGNAAIVNGYGIAGLVIYHKLTGGYTAYDRCSSYQPEKKCAVTLDAAGFTVTDPCSGSKFSLEDGSPVKAPATRSLRAYTVTVSNNFNIFVSN